MEPRARATERGDATAVEAEARPVETVADDVPEIVRDATLCKRCGICIAVCPADVYRADRDGLPIIAHPRMCIWCERCETYCPDYAIQLTGRRGF